MIPLSLLLRNKRKNLNIYIQVFSVILIFSILSSLHLIFGSIWSDPIHRTVFGIRTDLITSSLAAFNFLLIGYNYASPVDFFIAPLDILFTFLLILSFFSNQKKIKLVFFFTISILIIISILGSNLIDHFFIGILDVLKGFSFTRVDRILPLVFTLLFVLFVVELKNKNLKRFLYFISILSILLIQLKAPLPQITKYLLQKNMHVDQFDKTKKSILENDYNMALKIILDKKSYTNNKIDFNDAVDKTFDNYFKFKDYAFIKNIVKKSRVISVGLDPMVAVMNDIKVIDGYHTIYPLHYKIKFRKIIEKELEKNTILKNYYDNWGNRIYAFYSDKNNIMLNFQAAKALGADYIISRFPIKNNELKIVCYKCNNSNHLFLYKIL